MNLLTQIKIKGEVFCEYAFLSFEFLFENNTESRLSAEYQFSLPKGAVVSGMKIIDNEGRIITASVVSLTHGAAIWESSCSAVLRQIDEAEYGLCLSGLAKGGCRVCITVYAPTESGGLTIPLASGGDCQRYAEIELLLREITSIDAISVSYKTENKEEKEGLLIKTGRTLADKDFHITLGERQRVNSAIAVQDTFGGEMLCRIYPDSELFEGKTADAAYEDLQAVVIDNMTDAVIVTEGITEISGITVYAKYMGDVPPNEVEVMYGGRHIRAKLLKTSVYKSFAPVGLVCADYIYKALCKQLKTAKPSEIQKIKADMESVGVKFSALNAETALAAVMGSGKPKAVRVVMQGGAYFAESGSDDKGRFFKEIDTVYVTTNRILQNCIKTILLGIHANGGIFAEGELDAEIQKKQTLICLLALSAAGLLEAYGGIMEPAEKYLDGYSYRNIRFTKNSAEAKGMLKDVFKKEPAVIQVSPDILTAARFIWQSENRHFC